MSRDPRFRKNQRTRVRQCSIGVLQKSTGARTPDRGVDSNRIVKIQVSSKDEYGITWNDILHPRDAQSHRKTTLAAPSEICNSKTSSLVSLPKLQFIYKHHGHSSKASGNTRAIQRWRMVHSIDKQSVTNDCSEKQRGERINGSVGGNIMPGTDGYPRKVETYSRTTDVTCQAYNQHLTQVCLTPSGVCLPLIKTYPPYAGPHSSNGAEHSTTRRDPTENMRHGPILPDIESCLLTDDQVTHRSPTGDGQRKNISEGDKIRTTQSGTKPTLKEALPTGVDGEKSTEGTCRAWTAVCPPDAYADINDHKKSRVTKKSEVHNTSVDETNAKYIDSIMYGRKLSKTRDLGKIMETAKNLDQVRPEHDGGHRERLRFVKMSNQWKTKNSDVAKAIAELMRTRKVTSKVDVNKDKRRFSKASQIKTSKTKRPRKVTIKCPRVALIRKETKHHLIPSTVVKANNSIAKLGSILKGKLGSNNVRRNKAGVLKPSIKNLETSIYLNTKMMQPTDAKKIKGRSSIFESAVSMLAKSRAHSIFHVLSDIEAAITQKQTDELCVWKEASDYKQSKTFDALSLACGIKTCDVLKKSTRREVRSDKTIPLSAAATTQLKLSRFDSTLSVIADTAVRKNPSRLDASMRPADRASKAESGAVIPVKKLSSLMDTRKVDQLRKDDSQKIPSPPLEVVTPNTVVALLKRKDLMTLLNVSRLPGDLRNKSRLRAQATISLSGSTDVSSGPPTVSMSCMSDRPLQPIIPKYLTNVSGLDRIKMWVIDQLHTITTVGYTFTDPDYLMS